MTEFSEEIQGRPGGRPIRRPFEGDLDVKGDLDDEEDLDVEGDLDDEEDLDVEGDLDVEELDNDDEGWKSKNNVWQKDMSALWENSRH